jgi:hypothetical protein
MNKTLDWLLEPADTGVRYLALRDLAGVEGGELKAARTRAHREGPIGLVLDRMAAAGYWVQPGPGYGPKYRSTVWSIILLAQLGASVSDDERVRVACASLLEHTLVEHGRFSADGRPSGMADCLQGNLCAALLDLGMADRRLDAAFEWMARSVTGEGVAAMTDKTARLRYYAGKCGPDFACGANNKRSCAWGGVKVMLAFSRLPRERRTPIMERAIEAGVDFLFSKDPAEADYPSGWADKPSGNWWKFGFPVFYVTDLLQNVEALAGLGYARDPRLARALELVRAKADEDGRWALEYDYAGKTWVDFGPRKQANKWVTLRALRVLKAAE